MAKTNGTSLSLMVDGKEIAIITPCELDAGGDEWQKYIEDHGEPWSIDVTIPCEIISFDETWLLAYMGRMYAEEFRS